LHLITGEIVEIYVEEGVPWARVNVGGVHLRTPLTLLPDARVGEGVLLESGVAISTVNSEKEKEETHVSGDTRQSTGD
jgi:hydrogenase maturation factor